MNDKKAKETFLTRNFFVISFVNLFVFFSFQMIFPILPLYIQRMGASDDVIGFVIGVFTVSILVARPLTGFLLDRMGKKIVLQFGLVIFTIMVFSYGMATSIGLVLLVRFLHGFGWGFSGTSTATIASEIIPKSRFAEGMGYFSLANSISMAIAPAVGLYIGAHYQLRDVFFVATGLALMGLFLTFFLTCKKMTKPISPTLKFEIYEKRAIKPAVLMFFVSVTYGSIISFLPLYAYSRQIANIGVFFTVYALAILITRPLVGKIVDRYGFDITILPGFGCLLVGISSLAFASRLSEFLLVAVIYGIGFGALQTTIQTMAVRDVDRQRLGAANATLFTGFDLGMGLGVMGLGAVSALVGYREMYMYTALPIIISMLFYIFFVRGKYHNPKLNTPPQAPHHAEAKATR